MCSFFSQLLTQECLLCTAVDGGDLGLCASCQQDLPWHKIPRCPQCALPSNQGLLCGHCLTSPPAFDHTHALLRYDFPLDAMLQGYKYRDMLHMARVFGHLLAESVSARPRPDRLIPMPLHPLRLHERGYNQSLEVARIISKALDIRLDYTSCERIKFTPPQASLPLKARASNMKGAFACHAAMAGERVVLLDDVMTTGASLQALAKTIKKAGAAEVECWVIARTLPR
ncbi:ComF family protein [Methylovorus mays]|uniref:ComF family protein n=1 Tax=Methylovorus mays TaxID=184077 RepID=UPI001E45A476|nr:ComF family protein [Methylovorus mays]MCB5205960.1 ComF family protein [Methylovorus mays]